MKGNKFRTGPHEDEFKLQALRHSRNLRKIATDVCIYVGGGFLSTQIPHLQGEKINGSSKWKLDLPPNLEHDSHRHDKVNFSIPRMIQTIST